MVIAQSVMKENGLAIGMDFGSSQVKIGLVFQGHVIDRASAIPVREFDDPEGLIQAMLRVVGELRERHPGVVGLGLGVPGFVDFERGLIHEMTHVPGWVSVPIRRMLEERTGLPVVVDNRANCMAIAEWRCGAARGLRDVVFVNVQTGVGGAVIAGGRLIRGSRHGAGEIGQTSVDWRGEAGKYGNFGALENQIGLEALEASARAAYTAAGIDAPAQDRTLAGLIQAAHRADPVALEIWNTAGRILAASLANCCWLLNPEAVVIGGCLTRAGDLLFQPLREQIHRQLSDPFREHLMVLPASLGVDSGVVGAAALASESLRISI